MPDAAPLAAMTRSELRQRALRRQISHAALELFEERGYNNVTTDEIAERVHLSRRTLFRHFSSKDEILSTYGAERREEFAAIVEQKLVAGEELPAAISDAIRANAVLWEQERALFRRVSRVLRDAARVDPEATAQRRWALTITRSLSPHVGRDVADPELMVVGEAFAAAFRSAQHRWNTLDARGSLLDLLKPTLPLSEALYRASTLPTRSLAYAEEARAVSAR